MPDPSPALPTVSIVVNLYNGERYIAECLQSVLDLEGGYPLQIIVVDDASTDASEGVVRGFDDPRIEYLRLPTNQGAAAAITQAFQHVRGTYVGRIDYDDRYRQQFLTESVAALERAPQAAFVCGRAEMIDPAGVPTGVVGPSDYGEEAGAQDRFATLLRDHFVTAPTILGRTANWMRAMPVPQGMNFCDWYMNLTMAETAQVAVIDAVTADYRIHPANMHATMVMDGTGEAITFQVLDRFLVRSPRSEELAPRRRSILARHRARWGDAYFGAGLYAHAFRCYAAALRQDLVQSLKRGFLHRMMGAAIGPRAYRALKSVVARRGR